MGSVLHALPNDPSSVVKSERPCYPGVTFFALADLLFFSSHSFLFFSFGISEIAR